MKIPEPLSKPVLFSTFDPLTFQIIGILQNGVLIAVSEWNCKKHFLHTLQGIPQTGIIDIPIGILMILSKIRRAGFEQGKIINIPIGIPNDSGLWISL